MAQLLRERGQFVCVKRKEWRLEVFGIYQQQQNSKPNQWVKFETLLQRSWEVLLSYSSYVSYNYWLTRQLPQKFELIIYKGFFLFKITLIYHHYCSQLIGHCRNFSDRSMTRKIRLLNVVLEVGRGGESEVGYMEQLGSLIKADSNGNDNARKQWPDWINEEI